MATADEVTTQQVLALENGLQEALLSVNVPWFEDNWADDALYVHMSGGVDGKGDFIERLRSKATVYNDRKIGGIAIRRYGEAVVVTGWSTIDIVSSGTRKVLDTRFTRVYAHEDGRWLLVSSQSGADKARN